jgi:hypothetical protein
LFLMPTNPKHWFEECADQLSAFTGEDGAEDDIADAFGILGRVAEEFCSGTVDEDDLPSLGYGDGGSGYNRDVW